MVLGVFCIVVFGVWFVICWLSWFLVDIVDACVFGLVVL